MKIDVLTYALSKKYTDEEIAKIDFGDDGEMMEKLKEVQEAVDVLEKLSLGFSEQITTLEGEVQAVQTEQVTQKGELKQLQLLIDTLTNEVESQLEEVGISLTELNEEVEHCLSELGDTNADVLTTKKKLSDLEERVKTTETKLNNAIESLDGKVTKLEGTVATLELNFGAMNEAFTNVANDLVELNGRVVAVEEDNVKMNADIEKVKEDVVKAQKTADDSFQLGNSKKKEMITVVNGKGGNLSSNATWTAIANEIEGLETGGGAEVVLSDEYFEYDYLLEERDYWVDGRIVSLVGGNDLSVSMENFTSQYFGFLVFEKNLSGSWNDYKQLSRNGEVYYDSQNNRSRIRIVYGNGSPSASGIASFRALILK